MAASHSCTTQGSGPLVWHRMEAELGLCCQGRTGTKHSPRSAWGEIPAGGFPASIPNLHSQAGMQLQPAQTTAWKGHCAQHWATQTWSFFLPAAASHHRVNKQSHFGALWQKETPTGTRSAPALAGQSGCQGIESPRKLQYDSLNYTNCVSWYWGRINIVFLMVDFINTIGFSLTLRNCVSQFLQTISHQLCSFRSVDDW